MKKNLFMKAAAALTLIALAVAITFTPGIALAVISGVTIVPNPGESYSLSVGDTVTLNANVSGTVDGAMVYAWAPTTSTIISNSDPTLAATTITGLKPSSTSTTVTLTAYDDNNSAVKYKPTVAIKVNAMTINKTTLSLKGGVSDNSLSVSNTSVNSTTVWSSNNENVATVDPVTGEVTAVGGGTATITATNTPDDPSAQVQTKTCKVTVSPVITISPTTQNITAASTEVTVTLSVEYGGDLISDASTVSWTSTNSTAGILNVKPTALTDAGGVLQCEARFTSNSTGVNASTNVTATIKGAGDYTTSKTAVINVRTARYLTVEGDSTLNKTDRYGTYTVTLHEPDGSVVDNDTSTAHWSWSSSYLSLSSAALNDSRADMEDGTASIQLYARYNTPSSGTRLYAWIDDATSNRVYTTITISGLTSLPQTGQDMTLIYILGGSAILLFAAAGVWYGIRKKQTAE